MSHVVLGRASTEQQRQEIAGCIQRLASTLGESPKCFSYPVGGLDSFNAATRDFLREAGIDFAFSYYGGTRRFDDWDDYDVRRILVEPDLSNDMLSAIFTLPELFGRRH